MEQQEGSNKLLILIIILAVLVAGAYIWYYFYTDKESNCENNKYDNQIITQSNETENWQKYSDDEKKYTFSYPLDYKVEADNEDIIIQPISTDEGSIIGTGSDLICIKEITGPDISGYDKEYAGTFYNWVVSGFSTELDCYINQREETFGSNVFIVFDVASGMDNVIDYFITYNNIVYYFHDSVMEDHNHEITKQILSTFQFID